MKRRQTEATLSILAALFVLFSALLDPRLSAALAVLFLVGLSLHLWRSPQAP
jgi:hypothetical protein